jgi:hypothetical protein
MTMRYRLDRPWPVGQYLLPAQLILDTASTDYWSTVCAGKTPPPDAVPLDDEARAVMDQCVLPGKVWIASNKTPNFNDRTLATTRWVQLAFEITFKDREDTTLAQRIIDKELPGIAARCLAAYRRAKERGRLIQPDSGKRLAAQIVKSSDAFTRFMEETFVPDPQGKVLCKLAYEKLVIWCGQHGQGELLERIIPQNFRKNIRALPGFEGIDLAPRPHGSERRFAGLRLRTQDEYEAEFDE